MGSFRRWPGFLLGVGATVVAVAALSLPLPADYCAWEAVGFAIGQPLCGLVGDPDRGRATAADPHGGNCLACHRMPIPEQPAHGTIGPPLYGVGARLSPGEIRLRVVDEHQLNPASIMPGFYRDPRLLNRVADAFWGRTFLSAQQVEDLVAYLSSLTGPAPRQAPAPAVPAGGPVSGYAFLTPETRAMQDDEFENPGMMTVSEGERLYHERRPDEEHACADCHGTDGEELDPDHIAAYPVFDPNLGGLVTVQDRISHCWEINLDRFPLAHDDRQLVALETYIRHLARSHPLQVRTDGPMEPLLKEGEALYRTRFGQADLACYHCHVQHQGQMLRGQRLSQGQANGFPEYRLAKGRITSLHQRFRECFISFRAEPFDPGSREYKLLELYVMSRGNGLPVETPAIRY